MNGLNLSNTCFKYNGNKESIACIEIMNNYTMANGSLIRYRGEIDTYYWMINKIKFANFHGSSDLIVISPEDYLKLLNSMNVVSQNELNLKCKSCNEGKIERNYFNDGKWVEQIEDCPDCKGTGKLLINLQAKK